MIKRETIESHKERKKEWNYCPVCKRNIQAEQEPPVIVLALISCLLLVIALFLSASNAHAYTDEQIVNAIYKAEGGEKATYLYGIRSVRYADKAEARAICVRTVVHARKRWESSGKAGDFVRFLGRTYAPKKASNDPRGLNSNWERNVRFYLRKGA